MKIVVLGATGATGRQIVDQAVGRGHDVVAYVRRPEALEPKEGVTIAAGQLADQPTLQSILKGADAVLCCLGTHELRNVDFMQKSLPCVTGAMQAADVHRLILLSAYGVGETSRSASLLARFLYRTVVSSVYKDKADLEAALAQSGLKWTIIYPVILTNGPLDATAEVRQLSE